MFIEFTGRTSTVTEEHKILINTDYIIAFEPKYGSSNNETMMSLRYTSDEVIYIFINKPYEEVKARVVDVYNRYHSQK